MTRREKNDKAEVQALADRARAAVLALARRVKVLIEKGDRAAEKAEQFYKAAGIHIRQIKEQSLDNWETVVREQCNIGRSRAYELMAIADGKTTLEKVRAGSNERKKVHRAKSVPERTKYDEWSDAVAKGEAGDSCPIRMMAEERATGSATVDIEERRSQMAALDAEPDRPVVTDLDGRIIRAAGAIRHEAMGLSLSDTERFLVAIRDQIASIESEALQNTIEREEDLSIPDFLMRSA